MAQVSLLIVSWNSRSRLQRCLGSLPRTNVEIIVTDNASGDGSADMVAAEYPEITLIRETENRGFAAAINLAVQRATSPLVLLLNADVEIFPDAIDSLSSFLDTNPAYGAAGGRLVDADGQFQRGFSVRRFPTMASFAVDLLPLDTVWPNNPVSRRYHAADLDDRVTQPVDQPAAACLMVRRAALEQLGGLDERFYPAWFEDVDLCRRLKAAGWEIAFVAEATCRHEGGVAMTTLGLTAFSRIWYKNLRRYVEKHHGLLAARTIRALVVVGMAERFVVSMAMGRQDRMAAYRAVLVDALRSDWSPTDRGTSNSTSG